MLGDQIVTIGTSGVGENRPDHPIRVVEVRTTPHMKRGKYRGGSTGPGSDGVLRIATNLLDVPAETVAVLYEYRWTIEIFFRFFKHVLGCRHLLSHDEHGIEIQTYCAIIACMLISLWTGRKPTLRSSLQVLGNGLLLLLRARQRGRTACAHREAAVATSRFMNAVRPA